MVSSRCAVLLALAAGPLLAQPPADLWSGFDGESYELIEDGAEYRLGGLAVAGREPLAVPRAWLKPAAVIAEEENHYVSSLEWERPVTAFALGDGRVGLHLSSYTIAKEGSAMAAAGRDLFLIHDPAAKRLLLGLDLGATKGRVRVEGCFSAWYHRLHLGDVDCDGRLDLGVVEERIACTDDENDEETPYTVPFLRTGALRWYVLGEEGWKERPGLAGRLACFGMRAFPPLGVAQSPVDWVLSMQKLRPVLPPRGDSAAVAAAAATPPERVAGSRAVAFKRAGVRLHLPRAWTVERADTTWANVVTPEAAIDVRVAAIPAGRTLDQEIAERLKFERRMAESVKLWSLHTILEETGWVSASGLRGRRAIFGFAGAPRRLVYYLENHRRELVTINVRFHLVESGGFWDRYDRVLRDGLELLQAKPASD
jgi:hypothetical protein